MNLGGLLKQIVRGADLAADAGKRTRLESLLGSPEAVGSGFTSIKSRRKPELLQNFEAVIEDVGGRASPELASPEGLLGKTLIVAPGDITSGNRLIRSVGGRDLPEPVMTEAGPEFMDMGERLWASGASQMTPKVKASQQVENPVWAYTNMAEQSGDFSAHQAQVVAGLYRQADISRANATKIRDIIRKTGVQVKDAATGKYRTEYPFKDFTKAGDGEHVANYLMSLPGGLRKELIKRLDTSAAYAAGAPDIAAARIATANPELIGRDKLNLGYRLGIPDLERGLQQSTHASYPAEMLRAPGTPAYTLGTDIPLNLVMKNQAEAMQARGTGGLLVPSQAQYKVLEGSPYKSQQLIDDEIVDRMMTFTEIERTQGRPEALAYAAKTIGDMPSYETINEAIRRGVPAAAVAAMFPAVGGLLSAPGEAQADELSPDEAAMLDDIFGKGNY